VARFECLTDAEARTLTRAELLDRLEAESEHWDRKVKYGLTDEDRAAHREFGRIMRAYLSPGAAIQAAMDTLTGGQRPGYWESRPCDDKEVAEHA